MATSSIPRGIEQVVYKTQTHGKVVKYRVRIRSKKKGTYDRLFDELTEAKAFLNDPAGYVAATPAPPSKKEVLLNVFHKAIHQVEDEEIFNPNLRKLFDRYLAEKNYTGTDFLARNRHGSLKSFLNILATTKVEFLGDRDIRQFVEFHEDGTKVISGLPEKPLGELTADQVTFIQINSYIKKRQAQDKKRATILKELSILKQVFSRLMYLNPYGKSTPKSNPVNNYDRSLFHRQIKKEAQTPKPRRIAIEHLSTMETYLRGESHPEAYYVFALSLATAARRAEVLMLRRDRVRPNYLDLVYTKTGKPRKVYLTPEAKELIKEILAKNFDHNGEMMFTLTFTNLQKIWQRMVLTHPELKGVNFHRLRKESISRTIINLTQQATKDLPSLFLANFLGASNVDRFERENINPLQEPSHSTEAAILASIGHEHKQTTLNHYFEMEAEDTTGLPSKSN